MVRNRDGEAAEPPGDRSGISLERASGVQVGSHNVQVNYFYDAPRGPHAGANPQAPASRPAGRPYQGHAFISYVREDCDEVDDLQRAFEDAGIPVWRDTASLWPGEIWSTKIREAITQDALAFIACFSRHSAARQKSHQNEELLLAVEQLRLRRPSDVWLIPVRFDDCDMPDLDLGAGRTLESLNWVNLFGADRDGALSRLVTAVRRLLPQTALPVTEGPASRSQPPPPINAQADDARQEAGEAYEPLARRDPDPPGTPRHLRASLPFKYVKASQILAADADGVLDIAFSPDGTMLATGSRDGTIHLWDPDTRAQIRVLSGHTNLIIRVTFSQDGTFLASASEDGSVRLWDAEMGTCVRIITFPPLKPTDIAFSPDGSLLAIANLAVTELRAPDTGRLMHTISDRDSAYHVEFSRGGAWLAIANLGQFTRLWDPASGKRKRSIKGLSHQSHHIPELAFSPDDSLLAITDNDSVGLWNPATGRRLRSLGHPGYLNDVTFNSAGTLLATASDDAVRLWEPGTGACVRSLTGHTGSVRSVTFSPDDTQIATACYDGTIRLWRDGI